jgi:hypothetical protein
MVINGNGKSKKLLQFVYIMFEAGAGATSRYSSGSNKMMRLLPAPQHGLMSFFLRKTQEYHDGLIMNEMVPVSMRIR